ncbi:MAG TPA: CoA transferase, partial [Burkholderiaceae bacterium]|nr:CoA transferase [Burkholderiaceae bacterium]
MQPLRGLKVLDLTRALAGPFCTMILGDLGARVDKVEPAGTGDMSRTWGPFDRGESTYFLCANRNKRSLALDFRKPQANDLLRRMVLQADIVVENFRPGVMQRMGLSFEDLRRDNPRLICIGLSGFGSRGPYSDRAGFDQIAQGMSGLMSVTGPGDSAGYRVGIAVGDVVAGMWATIGALAAVQARERTGEGAVVETSLLRGLLSIMGVQGQRYLSLHETGRASGNSHPTIAPYGTYDCSDGPINLAPATASMWSALCRVLDLHDLAQDPAFADNASRVANRAALDARIAERLRTIT